MLGIDLPARLLIRAFDDLHTIADAARTLPEVEARLAAELEDLEERAAEVLATVQEAEARVAEGIGIGRDLDGRAGALLERATVIEDQVGQVVEAGDRIVIAAHAVADAGKQVAAALPSLETSAAAATVLAQTAEPLQGTVERMGRLLDRLPGARREHGG